MIRTNFECNVLITMLATFYPYNLIKILFLMRWLPLKSTPGYKSEINDVDYFIMVEAVSCPQSSPSVTWSCIPPWPTRSWRKAITITSPLPININLNYKITSCLCRLEYFHRPPPVLQALKLHIPTNCQYWFHYQRGVCMCDFPPWECISALIITYSVELEQNVSWPFSRSIYSRTYGNTTCLFIITYS